MKKLFLALSLLITGFTGQSQSFPVDGKKDKIVYQGSKRDTTKIEYDLKPKVKEWLSTTLRDKSKRFSYVADKNMFTGTVFTILKYKDVLGKEQRFPLYFTMNIYIVESSLLQESTYKYELHDFDVLGKNKKFFPAERLLIDGKDEQKDSIPTEHLQELKTQAADFIESIISGFHQSMLSGLPSQ